MKICTLLSLASALLVLSGCPTSAPIGGDDDDDDDDVVEAPTGIDELSAYLFQQFEHPNALEAGLENLVAYAEGVPLTADTNERARSLSALSIDDLEGITHPDGALGGMLGVGLFGPSAFSPEYHTMVIVLQDQQHASTDYIYDRTFVAPTDPSCFPTRACASLSTRNEVDVSNLIISMDVVRMKDYRWVDLPGGGHAILARDWIEQEFESDNGSALLMHSYRLDVFLPEGSGSVRYLTRWESLEVPGLGDDTMIAMIKDGMDDVIGITENYLESH